MLSVDPTVMEGVALVGLWLQVLATFARAFIKYQLENEDNSNERNINS